MHLPATRTDTLTTRRLTSVAEAAELLRAGKLVAFATETVYGLGVDASDSQAVGRLFRAKGRPSDNPLIVHLANVEDWPLAARELTPAAEALLKAFAPGPLTVVLPKQPAISPRVTAGLDSVGLRIPACPQALELLSATGKPIAAPSANRSGSPSCTTWQSVLEDLDGRIDAVLQGAVSAVGIESTVVDCRGERPILLRPGAVALAQLQSVVPSTIALPTTLPNAMAMRTDTAPGELGAEQSAEAMATSPGMRHPHYRPRAAVRLVESPSEVADALQSYPIVGVAYAGTRVPPRAAEMALVGLFDSAEDYAHGFYEFLRRADRAGAEVILLERVAEAGIGQALRDRQARAAGEDLSW